MNLVITQLPAAESAHLVLDALRSYWPHSHFTISLTDDALTLRWADGPSKSDVYSVATRYQPDPDLPEWRNSTVLAHPDGALEAVLPSLPDILCERHNTPRAVLAVTSALRQEGREISANDVAAILNDGESDHPEAGVVYSCSDSFASPLRRDSWWYESTTEEDSCIEELCDAIDRWGRDPEGFDQWQLVITALHDQELSAVLVSALSDNKPQPGAIETLLNEVITRCLETSDLDSATQADHLRQLGSPEDDGGLFPRPTTRESTTLAEMGDLLRALTGVDF